MELYDAVICKYRFVCARKWDDLEIIESEVNRRHCNFCSESVYLAKDYEEFVSHAAAQRCVAIIAKDTTGQLLGSPW